MKKLSILLTLAVFIMGGAFLNSCQKKDDVMLDSELYGLVTLDAELVGVVMDCTDELPVFVNDLPDCEEVCVGDMPYVQGVVSAIEQWTPITDFAYYKNNKYFTAEVWNDGDKFYVKSTVFGYQYDREKEESIWGLVGPTCDNYPFETVKITINGAEYEISMDDPDTEDIIETATEYIAEFSLEVLFPDGWSACDEVEYNVRLEGSGQPAELEESMTYSLYEACVDCDDKFTLEEVSECGETDRYAEFKFVAGEDGEVKIQGGLTNGATDWTSEIWVNDEQLMDEVDEVEVPIELNYGVTPAGHVHNWIGDLDECDEVLIKIWWTASNEEIIDSWSVSRWDEDLKKYVDIEGMETDEVDCEVE